MANKDGWIEEKGIHSLYIQNNKLAYVEQVSVQGHKLWAWAAVDYAGCTWNRKDGSWYSKGSHPDLEKAKEQAEKDAFHILESIAERLSERRDFAGEEPKEKPETKRAPAKIDTPFGDLIVFPRRDK